MNRFRELRLSTRQAWGVLALTVLSEVGATVLLKVADGFTSPLPSLVSVLGFALAVVCLAKVLEAIPTSVAYTVWTGSGSALVVLIGVFGFGEDISPSAMLGVVLVVAGVAVLNLAGASPAEPPL